MNSSFKINLMVVRPVKLAVRLYISEAFLINRLDLKATSSLILSTILNNFFKYIFIYNFAYFYSFNLKTEYSQPKQGMIST